MRRRFVGKLAARLVAASCVAATLLGASVAPAAMMLVQDAGSMATASKVVGGHRYTVTLDPRPAVQLGPGATAAHRMLLNNTFDGIGANGVPNAAIDWTFRAGAGLMGTITIDQYDAATNVRNGVDLGGAIFDARYNGPGAPTNLRWVQVIDTNRPLGGAGNPYVDPRPNDDRLPFYFTEAEMTGGFSWTSGAMQSPVFSNPGTPLRAIQNPNANTDLVFLDFASRAFLARPAANWDAFLYLVEWDGVFGGVVTIHDGVQWGFTIVPEPTAAALLLAVGLLACGLRGPTRRSS